MIIGVVKLLCNKSDAFFFFLIFKVIVEWILDNKLIKYLLAPGCVSEWYSFL